MTGHHRARARVDEAGAEPERAEGRPGERGIVGGIEVLPFGFLVFVLVTLLIANVWAVIDAKMAVETAAREGGRAYVEADSDEVAATDAHRAARDAMVGVGRDPDRVTIRTPSGRRVRCAVIQEEVDYRVPALTLPLIGGFGKGFTVTGRHREVIDPFRSGLGSDQVCG